MNLTYQAFDKEIYDNQMKNDRGYQNQNPFSNNSSQILNNPSIPLNIYPMNASQFQQFQLPASQMSRRDVVLDEKTRKKQAELLSASYQGMNQNPNGPLDLNNYMKGTNNDEAMMKQMPDSNARSMLNSRSMVEKPGYGYGSDLKQQVILKKIPLEIREINK